MLQKVFLALLGCTASIASPVAQRPVGFITPPQDGKCVTDNGPMPIGFLTHAIAFLSNPAVAATSCGHVRGPPVPVGLPPANGARVGYAVLVLTTQDKPQECNSLLCSTVAHKLSAILERRACQEDDKPWGFGKPADFAYRRLT